MLLWLKQKGQPLARIPALRAVARRLLPHQNAPEPARRQPYTAGAYLSGINLFGYLKAPMGLGQGARLYANALAVSDIPHTFLCTTIGNPSKHSNDEFTGSIARSPVYNTNLIHVNAEQLPLLISAYPASAWNKRYQIGVWLWELEELPEEWKKSFQYLDEIWTPSTFSSRAVASVSPLPVSTIPYGIHLNLDAGCSRKTFGLPENRYLFLSMYDVFSVAERKNPMGAIEAYFTAFGRSNPDTGLVIKVNNATPCELSALQHIIGDCKNVYVLSSAMSKPQVNSLIQCCDTFVSLHRSEGFGLVLAEAMFLGTPVVATNWSANTDFMNEHNSCPVGYRLVDVGGAYFKGSAGQRWAEPDIGHAAEQMKKLFLDDALRQSLSREAKITMQTEFSPKASADKMLTRIRAAGLIP